MKRAIVMRRIGVLPRFVAMASKDIGCKRSRQPPISPSNEDSNNLLMSVYVVFTFMLNNIFNSLDPIEENGLQVFEGQFTPDVGKSSQAFFGRVKHPILSFLLQLSEYSKVARTQVW
jgi:hypothetical protein